jgi:uncharacterized protein YqhQ
MTTVKSAIQTFNLAVAQTYAAVALSNGGASIGGQAVMDGVMMRSPGHWSLAIRRHTGEIVEIHREYASLAKRHRWARLPVVRGCIALGESLAIGFRALSVSAHYAAEGVEARMDAKEAAKLAEQGEAPDNVIPLPVHDAEVGADIAEGVTVDGVPASVTPIPADEVDGSQPESLKGWQIAIAFIFAMFFTVMLFKLLPALLSKTVIGSTDQSVGFLALEGGMRIGIFCLYLGLIGFMPDMKRVFQFHSAEHKAINAWENDVKLTPELVNRQTRIHVRCGTAFLLWVFVVAIFVFGVFGYFVHHPSIWQIALSRVLLLPIIAGISFELIKFAGKYPNNRVLRGILAPGLWLQYLTTRQCNEEQCEVSVRALEIVLEKEYPGSTLEEALHEAEEERVQVI